MKAFLIKIIKKIIAVLSSLRRSFLYHKMWPYYFKKYSRKPVDEKKAVLAYSHLYEEMPDNLRCVKTELEKRGYKCVVISKAEETLQSRNPLINELKKWFYGKEFFREYATAKALFLTDYFFPAYACKPREGQSVVQLWHGCGAFKKWGYSTAEKKWGASKKELDRFPIHNTYTHVCVSSPKVSFAYAEAFGCSENVVMPLGAPRTDIYFDPDFIKKSRGTIDEKFPQINGRKVILYAPTFRGDSVGKSYIKNMLDVEKMSEKLGNDYVLLIKQHPLTADKFSIEGSSFAFDISKDIAIETALCAADIVITDYSSLIFEYALLERPMIFFAYDLAEYEDARSFYFGYEGFVPGEIVVNTDEIISELRRLETDFDKEKIRRFRQDYMCACDGKSTERILNEVLKSAESKAKEKILIK